MVSPEPTTVIARGLDAVARQRAAVALQREGIEFRRTEGGLAVSSRRLAEAEKILGARATAGESSGSTLSTLAGSSSIWRSSAENKRMWQAGVMSELGRLISEMDPVASAAVMFDAGSPGGLGAKARTARAAVKVTLAKGRKMSPGLVVAIGELVSGSVAADIGDVRVIDQTGRSYRPSPETLALAKRHAVESYYSEKIASALKYIPGVSIDVHADGGEDRLRIWVSVPRSYLKNISPAGRKPDLAGQLASVKNAAKSLFGKEARHEITVVPHGRTVEASVAKTRPGVSKAVFLSAMAASVLVGGLGFGLLRRRRRGVGSPRRAAPSMGDESIEPVDRDINAELSGDISAEHPQTLALILVRMPSAQAADIMARLPVELRSEVARRMGDLDDADPAVISEINRNLSHRAGVDLADVSEQSDRPETITRRKAERAALRLLAFEDVTLLGAGELRAALGAVEPDDLAISLRMAGKQVRRKVLGSLSTKDSEYIRARMDRIGPMRICDVEAARQRVMETVTQAAGAPETAEETV